MAALCFPIILLLFLSFSRIATRLWILPVLPRPRRTSPSWALFGGASTSAASSSESHLTDGVPRPETCPPIQSRREMPAVRSSSELLAFSVPVRPRVPLSILIRTHFKPNRASSYKQPVPPSGDFTLLLFFSSCFRGSFVLGIPKVKKKNNDEIKT